jgi:2-iminobutanoate/2-iminopropanoate deaminase
MGSILKAAGMNFGNVVKVSIFIKKMSDFEKVNKIYKEFFKEPFPARETIGVAELPQNALIEISAVALK